ncbi:MAG: hypothetical protein UY01_C0002G0003 [Candidatus Nomurabacteria bacterium GW2011_GWB1_47_6]|uniref:Ceramidase n=1 Tax=Candidatus Nomurabacteria bacterium GW2011_GWB1_47_6 TaxID=1618749 RepID=A0A0G1W0N0_9BACT|nr:MAG: hypothetical protein UY01_C0002G0003 [Candidatus Nomurabacteria bacterium GW2011_GWB1_47_6]
MLDIPTQYCEHIMGHFLSQPLNAISNIAYFLAAFLSYIYLRQHTAPKLYVLPILLGVVGIGSMWWHITNSSIGDILDTYSIALFASVTTLLFLTKITKSKIIAAVSFAALLSFVLMAERFVALNGSLPYVVLLGGFLIAGKIYVKKFPSVKVVFISTSLTFLIAITLRSLDIFLCPILPFGTHFIWHILIAVFGYQIVLMLAHSDSVFTQGSPVERVV